MHGILDKIGGGERCQAADLKARKGFKSAPYTGLDKSLYYKDILLWRAEA